MRTVKEHKEHHMVYVEKKDTGPKSKELQKRLDHGTENEVFLTYFKKKKNLKITTEEINLQQNFNN